MSNAVARSAIAAALSFSLAACSGSAGPAGPAGGSVTVTPEPPGANCALGGVAVTADGGTPTYVCNGPDGASVAVVTEPAGANCPDGGVAVSSGSGAPVYVCSGADATPPTVTGEPAGANCPEGGLAVQVGAGTPSYVCNGAPGADGGTPTITAEPPGANCTAGGVKIQLGVEPAQYVCNGTSVVLDPCVDSLYGPIRDPWGATWDGSERGLDTLSNAQGACEAIGGRLPIATELLRVSAVQAGGVGETYDTNYLWTLNPISATQQAVGRMSDGTFTPSPLDTRRPYRCLCPAATPAFFDESACFGPPGATCSQLATEGGRYRVDKSDRAMLPKGAAMWECAFVHGHLADPMRLLEGIAGGLPNGSGSWLHTADDGRHDSDVLVKWTGTQPAWAADATNITVGFMTDARPFRCVGLDFAAEPHPVTITNEFIGPGSLYKGERVDSASATWVAAHDTCWARGGHLPRATELGELVQQGLPGGSATPLWTSDQEGWNGVQFLAATVRWTGVEARFGYAAPLNSWAYKTDAGHPYRCIYYPIDAGFAGPAAAQCNGGCQQLAVGSGPARMWLDAFDRTPASVGAAARVCLASGGRLASERDLTEAIRAGLPNGSATWLHTSDLEFGDFGINVGTVRWTGTDPAFTDQYAAYATWGALTTSGPYRCVWTNELR